MRSTETPLSSLLAQICQNISRLDPAGDSPAFAEALIDARPHILAAFDPRSETVSRAAQALAAIEIGVIRQIPELVAAISQALDRHSLEPAERCALVGTLGYLVRPRDLLPDKLPGGFGFVDDGMMLHAAAIAFADHLPAGFDNRDAHRRQLALLSACVPGDRVQEFAEALEGVSLAFHAYLWQPAEEVEELIEAIEEDPLGTEVPDPTSNAVPLPAEKGTGLNMSLCELEIGDEDLVLSFNTLGNFAVALDGTNARWL